MRKTVYLSILSLLQALETKTEAIIGYSDTRLKIIKTFKKCMMKYMSKKRLQTLIIEILCSTKKLYKPHFMLKSMKTRLEIREMSRVQFFSLRFFTCNDVHTHTRAPPHTHIHNTYTHKPMQCKCNNTETRSIMPIKANNNI